MAARPGRDPNCSAATFIRVLLEYAGERHLVDDLNTNGDLLRLTEIAANVTGIDC